ESTRRQDEHRELDQFAAQMIGMLQHVFRRNDARAMASGIDHHVIRSIDVGTKLLPLLPYPRCGRLGHPWARAPRQQPHFDPKFRSDTRECLRRKLSIGGLDQVDQITAVALEPENAAQNPLGYGEGSTSGFW